MTTQTDHAATRQQILEPLGLADMVRFAGASGDFNPMHFDNDYAKENGFPSVFAMGMLVAGTLLDFTAGSLGLENVRSTSIRFQAPTWPGDVLKLSIAGDVPGRHDITAVTDAGTKISGTAVAAQADGAQTAPPVSAPDERLTEIEAIELSPVSFPVERGQIMQFARAVRSNNPIHFDTDAARSAGFADVPAPLAFTCTAAHWTGGNALDLPRGLGLDVRRVVHGEHAWWFTRNPVAGDFLHGTRRVAAAFEKQNRSGATQRLVLVDTNFVDASGSPVLGERITLIELPAK